MTQMDAAVRDAGDGQVDTSAPRDDTSGESSASERTADALDAAPVGSDADSNPTFGGDSEAGVLSDGASDVAVPDAQETRADAVADADAAAGADAEAGRCGTVYFTDTFGSGSSQWTLDPTWTVAPTCMAPPAPERGNPDPMVDHTTGALGGVLGAYACGNNPKGMTSPFRYATSVAVDVSGASSLHLTFYRWLNTDRSTYMVSTVDVYDGSAWVNVYTNSMPLVTDSEWMPEDYDVTPQRNAAFQVRFGYAVTSTSVYAMSCWNVDDVTLSSASCP
jgi:hypothetical protein